MNCKRTETRFSHLGGSSSEDCLCLICRKIGHVVESCTLLRTGADIERPSPPFDLAFSSYYSQTQALCQGCQQLVVELNDLSTYRPLSLYDDTWEYQIPPLGPAESVQLLSTCPLCRFLFDITYLPSESLSSIIHPAAIYEGEFVLTPAWTIHRLEKELSWLGKENGEGRYAKCIFPLVTLPSRFQDSEFIDQALDAIAILEDGEGSVDSSPALGVKEVNPLKPDYGMIRRWLHRCDELHPLTCRPLVSQGLEKIKLVDVETHQIVKYPLGGCDYIALSYVWGGVEQSSYKVGDTLPTVPATLEDAMAVTRILGKRYFWADSLCIDQGDNAEKAVQIALMSSIYTGAWATIFCLPGKSARSGLPRVGRLDGVIPQLSCKIGSKRWLSVMPTLSQQLAWSPWATRAWTFQEGLLSPRRLFFTNHQVYFECNAAQCCESLDDSNSPFHLASDEQRHSLIDETVGGGLGLPAALGHGVFRDPFRPFCLSQSHDDPFRPPTDDKFRRYLQLLSTFTRRKLTQDADSTNAFSAIMTRFEESGYEKGFVHGIPIEELPKALVWTHEAPFRRRIDFPTWSWAGWEGPVRPFTDGNVSFTFFRDLKIDTPPLRIWKAGDTDVLELIHDFSPIDKIMKKMETLQNRNRARAESPTSEESSQGSRGINLVEDGRATPDESADDLQAAEYAPCPPDSDHGGEADSLEHEANSSERASDQTDSTNAVYYRSRVKVPFRPQWYEEWDETWMVNICKDPIFTLAKEMAGPVHPGMFSNVGTEALLIQGVVIRLAFSKPNDGDGGNRDDLKSDDDKEACDTYHEKDSSSGHRGTRSDCFSGSDYIADDLDSGTTCHINIGGEPAPLELTFYGHGAKEHIEERSGVEQHFLLLSRDRRDEDLVMAALLHIDWEDDLIARRAGVASITVDGVEKWAGLRPETRMLKLK